MDYGGSLGYMIIDTARTWPVSGEFDEAQLRAYRCALEALKAMNAEMHPGATREGIREITRLIPLLALIRHSGKHGMALQPHWQRPEVADACAARQHYG